MVLFNFMDETGSIETVSRYNGGWLKTVNGLDKSQTNGFSIKGDFVKAGDYKMDYKPGLYLDCSKEGSRKNQVWNYHLFRVDQDGFHLLQTVKNGGRNWACEFWESIESELNENSDDKITGQDILNELVDKYDDSAIEELRQLLNTKKEKIYNWGTIKITKSDFESYLKLNGATKVNYSTEELTAKYVDALKDKKDYSDDEIKAAIEEVSIDDMIRQVFGYHLISSVGWTKGKDMGFVIENIEWLTRRCGELKDSYYMEYAPNSFVIGKLGLKGVKVLCYKLS